MKVNSLIINTALADALEVIGDRWALLILRDVFVGLRRFEQFRQNTGASRATLTRRLESLVANDILYKRIYSTTGKRFEYRLTEKGLALFPVSLLAWQWEYVWDEHAKDNLPKSLYHSTCHQALNPVAVCRHCNHSVEIGDVKWPDISHRLESQFQELKTNNKQRRVRSSVRSGQEDLSLVNVSSLIGDRWSLLVIVAAFLGESRYDSFLKQLNIASNILISRLNVLVEASILKRFHYQDNPPRSEYRLTEKGKSLYPLIMAMRQWAIDWVPKNSTAEVLIHKSCGKPLIVDVHCDSCLQKPWPRDVQFRQKEPV